MNLTRKGWLAIAAVITLIAAALWLLGVIPWWGILIAVPVATVLCVGVLLAVGVAMWMASGSN